MSRISLFIVGAAATMLTASAATAQCSSEKGWSSTSSPRVKLAAHMTMAGGMDIVDTAVEAGSFKTLAAALDAADLIPALKGDGPFTVFAPTDEAFAKLPKGTVQTLLKKENRGLLTAILTYHVVPGRYTAADVVTRTGAATLNGQRVDIATNNGGVQIDNANVIKADIGCANGVIHVIDRVIMPGTDDLVAAAVNAGSFETLVAAVKAAGLASTLTGGEFTVFAPTDAAFAKLPAGTVESLLEPENRSTLIEILKYHVVPGRVYARDALNAETAETAAGARVRFTLGSGLRVNDANVINANIETSNGVIHVIDQVLLPS
ncbi:MAG: fasciclin domain-containing protein [Planctomycetota bacterium]